MLAELYTKTRAHCGDFGKSSYEIFEYTTKNVFTVAQSNISITLVLINGVPTSDYTFDATTNKITITASGLASTDKIEVDFTYNKYSTSELKEYIRSALGYISIYAKDEKDMEIEDEGIYPTPSNAMEDLIAIIASIIILPNFSRKSLPGGITEVYPRTKSKDKIIEEKIVRFNRGLGVTGIIELE